MLKPVTIPLVGKRTQHDRDNRRSLSVARKRGVIVSGIGNTFLTFAPAGSENR